MNWQSISTAPKDMASYLFLCNGVVVQGFRDATGALCVCIEAGTSRQPPWRNMRRKPLIAKPSPPEPRSDGSA